MNHNDNKKEMTRTEPLKSTASSIKPGRRKRWTERFEKHLNFYRAHLLAFTFLPLIFAIVLLLGNKLHSNKSVTIQKAKFIDCLFMCYSAMTMTGLNTIPLASINRFQQAILYILMTIGSTTSVSILMIYIRLRFFKQRFRHILYNRTPPKPHIPSSPFNCRPVATACPIRTNSFISKLTDYKLEEPSSTNHFLSVDLNQANNNPSPLNSTHPKLKPITSSENNPSHSKIIHRRNSDSELPHVSFSHQTSISQIPKSSFPRSFTLGDQPKQLIPLIPLKLPIKESVGGVSNTQVEFLVDDNLHHHNHRPSSIDGPRLRKTRSQHVGSNGTLRKFNMNESLKLRRIASISSQQDFGGFPNPIKIILSKWFKWLKNQNYQLNRNRNQNQNELEFVRSTSLHNPERIEEKDEITWFNGKIKKSKLVSYITFNAIVGRNSNFLTLTSAQEEELGGVEYKSLSILLKIVISYSIVIQLISIIVLWSSLALSNNYDHIFNSDDGTSIGWYSIWITCSSFTNGGMSLIDAGYTVFQDAYILIIISCFLILAGNTGFPILLRFTIWLLTKLYPKNSKTKEVLNFLLDHPRRCFVYLFQSTQTYYLLISILILNLINWLAFLILNIGNSEIEKIPIGIRIIDGLLQSLSVRAAGFSIVSISALAPAVQVLYIIMMYIAVYPIAMSIRSTNVYEERSLGIFDQQETNLNHERSSEISLDKTWWEGSRSYLSVHLRHQLAFDIWWLFLALWIICIVERSKIIDSSNSSWFNVFTILFELVSAYGTIGLSLGVPFSSTSLSGQFSVLSKLVIILVMVRGRHRGLPIAIDRAVLIPTDKEQEEEEEQEGNGTDDIV